MSAFVLSEDAEADLELIFDFIAPADHDAARVERVPGRRGAVDVAVDEIERSA
jgi:plasmid stabilization system protein ParE